MKTFLYDSHVALGAKMVDFAGWEMPIQYAGIVQEHMAVREGAGLFDVSHMGLVVIEGADAAAQLDYLSANAIAKRKVGTATYTVWCHENGGSVDDLLIFRESEERFFTVFNAANREKDLAHLKKHTSGLTIEDRFDDGILALQGPQAVEFLPEGKDLKRMRFIEHDGMIISRTGYTGSDGFEIYGPPEALQPLWDRLIDAGVEPVGLGARDTLRLEKGFALYGHELSDTIAPTESVAAWTVDWDRDFIGKEALLALEKKGEKRRQCALRLTGRGIAREGHRVQLQNQAIGTITSGTFSPSLKTSIALALVSRPLSPGDNVEIIIRDKPVSAEVVELPFLQ